MTGIIHMTGNKSLPLWLMAGIAAAALANAQTAPPQTHGDSMKQGGAMKMAAADSPASFVSAAGLAGMTEVALGKAALKKSEDPAIQEFAQRMVRDHGNANEKLAAIAKRKALSFPTSLDSEHKSAVQQVTAKSGAEFEAAYAQQMVEDHDKAVALFESASKMSDTDLSGFASKTLPTLKEHKEMADRLQAGKRSASTTSSSVQHPKQY